MTKNIDTINAAVALIVKAAILAASFSGRVRKRSLKRLARMDADIKDKEIIFLRDKVIELKNSGIHSSKKCQEETKEPSIHSARKAVHYLSHGNLSDTEM